MRDLKEVLNCIIDYIQMFEKYDGLQKRLENIEYSLYYTATEAMGIRWEEVYDTLIEFIYPPRDIDDCHILSIWSTRPLEEICKERGIEC